MMKMFRWLMIESVVEREDHSARTDAVRIVIWLVDPTAGRISTLASSKSNPASEFYRFNPFAIQFQRSAWINILML